MKSTANRWVFPLHTLHSNGSPQRSLWFMAVLALGISAPAFAGDEPPGEDEVSTSAEETPEWTGAGRWMELRPARKRTLGTGITLVGGSIGTLALGIGLSEFAWQQGNLGLDLFSIGLALGMPVSLLGMAVGALWMGGRVSKVIRGRYSGDDGHLCHYSRFIDSGVLALGGVITAIGSGMMFLLVLATALTDTSDYSVDGQGNSTPTTVFWQQRLAAGGIGAGGAAVFGIVTAVAGRAGLHRIGRAEDASVQLVPWYDEGQDADGFTIAGRF